MKHSLRGFTLIEVLIGLLILGLVMTTSLAAFYERERRLRHAEETFLVWQAISNEAELVRFQTWHTLPDGAERPFQSDLAILESLGGVETRVKVTQEDPNTKMVHLSVRWSEDRSAGLDVVRTNTGGSNLW